MTKHTEPTKNLQDELVDSAHRIWLAGLGALAAAEQEGSKVFSRLVERGKEVETRGKDKAGDMKDQVKTKVDDLKDQAGNVWSDLGDKLDDTLTAALHRLGVPTRDEIHALTAKIDELNAKIEHMKPSAQPVSTHKPAAHAAAS